jgi:hypothetical protein
VEVDESQLAHELDATESTPTPHTTSYSTANEKMRAEPPDPTPDEDQDQVSDALSAKAADDTASLHSTSSRFWPTLRRRTTDRSGDSLRLDSQRQEKRRSGSQRPRRTSDVASDIAGEDDSSLNLAVALELQKQGKEGGEWGIGDEARMSLE